MQLPSLQVNFPSGHGLGVVGVVVVGGGGSSTNRHFGVNEISSMAISPEIQNNCFSKGQVISNGFFGVFNFFQKTNENTSHSSKNEFIRSFFGRIHSLTICFPN